MVESKNPDILSICWGIVKKKVPKTKKSAMKKAAKAIEEDVAASSERTNSEESDGGYHPPVLDSTRSGESSTEKDGTRGGYTEGMLVVHGSTV